MRRLWYFLRDLVWTAVLSVALVIAGIALAVVGADISLVLATGFGAGTLALLSTRS